jgi:predicted dehydrogenase
MKMLEGRSALRAETSSNDVATLPTESRATQPESTPRPPRLGFLGVGWIGRHRMTALLEAGAAEAVAVCDPCENARGAAGELAPAARRVCTVEELLEQPLDGLVIATPSALHAQQAIAALQRGIAVFCQKPLARTAAEAGAIVQAARSANRLLGLDLSYRYTAAYRAIGQLIREGELGDLYGLDLTFHNAYGPDKPWFRDPALSGGGCMIDLGVHLVDMALLSLNWPEIDSVTSSMHAAGVPLQQALAASPSAVVEDYATATLRTVDGRTIRIACSWNLHAGRDAAIEFNFYGTRGGAAMRNLNGSFYDFVAERYQGTGCEIIARPPDAWGGRAAIAWARRLALSKTFDEDAGRYIAVARVMDRIYGR